MPYRFDFSFLAAWWPTILVGVWTTIELTVLAVVFGGIGGTVCAVARAYGGRVLAWPVAIYIETIRNTPLLVQMFIVYFGLSELGLTLPAFWAAGIALAINMGAYVAEIMRAGIESIKQTQVEAARTLGLSSLQQILYIVLPPATQRMFPSLSSQVVLILLSTSITSQISVEEVSAAGATIQSATFRSFETYIVVAAIYLALASMFRALLHLIQGAAFPYRRSPRARP